MLAGWERRGGGRTAVVSAACARIPRRRWPATGAGRKGRGACGSGRGVYGVTGVQAVRWAVKRDRAPPAVGQVGSPYGGALRSLSGLHGHRPLHGMGRPRAGCVLRQSCGRNEAGPYAVGHFGADQGAEACFLSSVAATTCRWLHRYGSHPPSPGRGLPSTGSRCSHQKGPGWDWIGVPVQYRYVTQ